MPCVDQDKFDLAEHGQDASVALNQLLRVPKIRDGALGKVIRLIQQEVLGISRFNWIPLANTNGGARRAFGKSTTLHRTVSKSAKFV